MTRAKSKISFEDQSVRVNGHLDWTHKLAVDMAPQILGINNKTTTTKKRRSK